MDHFNQGPRKSLIQSIRELAASQPITSGASQLLLSANDFSILSTISNSSNLNQHGVGRPIRRRSSTVLLNGSESNHIPKSSVVAPGNPHMYSASTSGSYSTSISNDKLSDSLEQRIPASQMPYMAQQPIGQNSNDIQVTFRPALRADNNHSNKNLFARDYHYQEKMSFKCDKCNASFRRKESLNAHNKYSHLAERPFKCLICGFRFIKKDHAMKHWKIVHLKERPFKCNTCDSRFGQRSDLNKHFQSVHLGLKPFQCSLCGLKFSHRGNLVRHKTAVHERRK